MPNNRITEWFSPHPLKSKDETSGIMTDTGMVKITGRFKERIAARLQLKLLFVTHNILHNSCDSCLWDVFSYSAKFRVKFANFPWFISFEQFSFEFWTQFSCFLQIFGVHPIAAEPNTRSWSSVMEVKTSLQCPSKIKWKHPAMASTRRIHGISMFTVAVDSVDVSIKVQVFKTRPSKDRIFEQLQNTSNPLKLSRVNGKRDLQNPWGSSLFGA